MCWQRKVPCFLQLSLKEREKTKNILLYNPCRSLFGNNTCRTAPEPVKAAEVSEVPTKKYLEEDDTFVPKFYKGLKIVDQINSLVIWLRTDSRSSLSISIYVYVYVYVYVYIYIYIYVYLYQ